MFNLGSHNFILLSVVDTKMKYPFGDQLTCDTEAIELESCLRLNSGYSELDSGIDPLKSKVTPSHILLF